MLYVLTIIATVFIANTAINAKKCRTVKKGSHYSTLIPFHGFKSGKIISTRVNFTNSAATYVFPSTDPKASLCTVAWNPLWRACRCGYFTLNHKDSDRFAFRRAQTSCLVDELKGVNDEKKSCSESNLIELAAFAYDNGTTPFSSQGRLFKEFSTKLQVNIWYKLTLIFDETKTTYQLFDNNDQLLETQEIDHRQCRAFSHGMRQSFYFGGECPAPQDVSVCYDKV